MVESPLHKVIEACKDWADDTELALKMRVNLDTGKLYNSIKGRVKIRHDEPYAITFRFLRYGAWLEKGAGKGAGGAVGSRWINRKGERKTTNPLSRNKMGIKRQEQPWFDYTIQERLPILNQLIARHLADSIVRYIGMR